MILNHKAKQNKREIVPGWNLLTMALWKALFPIKKSQAEKSFPAKPFFTHQLGSNADDEENLTLSSGFATTCSLFSATRVNPK